MFSKIASIWWQILKACAMALGALLVICFALAIIAPRHATVTCTSTAYTYTCDAR